MTRPCPKRPRRPTTLAIPLLLGLLVLAGCSSSPNPALYTIAPVAGTTMSGGPKVVVLQQIGVARYLDRTPIVQSSEGYRLDVLANDWWGEPLPAMLSRVLVEELSQRLPQSTVLNEGGAVSAKPDVTIELNFQRLDRDASGAVLLMAQASLSFPRQAAPVLRSFRISVPTTGRDTAAQVAATSAALGQLADGLAATMTQARPTR